MTVTLRKQPFLFVAALGALALNVAAWASPAQDHARQWATKLWEAAKMGRGDEFQALLNQAPTDAQDPATSRIARQAKALAENLDKREQARAQRLEKIGQELDAALAAEMSVTNLSKALTLAVEQQDLSTDKAAVLGEPRIKELVDRAQQAAETAEREERWLDSSELYVRLHALFEESGRFKADAQRQSHRLAMLRMYAPRRLWELRSQRLVNAGEAPLPEYRAVGEAYTKRFEKITRDMVVSALSRAVQNVDRVPMKEIILGGLFAVRTFANTPDLRESFPGLADETARAGLIEAVDREIAAAQAAPELDAGDCESILDRVIRASGGGGAAVPPQALLHEFGNGGMETLDEFSTIIWPDELARFQRVTQSSFTGVGVQIEFDELLNVRVVTPIDGTPAHRAGVRPGDLIKKVDGQLTVGLSLDQVVELITGPQGTKVVLSMERSEEDPAHPGESSKQEFDVKLTRARVDITSVKGWKRQGEHESDWSWFIDPQDGIGYLRLTQFTENSTAQLRRAIGAMRKGGLKGLVFDLRFNPGGLLDQAVEVSRLFVDRGILVMMRAADGRVEQPESANNTAMLRGIPVVVLVNAGSASASEIVAGAVQHYGRKGVIDAVVLGQRSFGKGSVQKVWGLAGSNAMLKITTQHYMLPDSRIIHRMPGAAAWGVEPNLNVEMLPQQITDAFVLRKNADVLPGEAGAAADPQELVEKGVDLQLQGALVLLQSRRLAEQGRHAGAAGPQDSKEEKSDKEPINTMVGSEP